MYSQTQQNQRSRYRSTDNGKCICLSFPAHEKRLIEDLDHLADQEFVTRSQYIRRLIRREKQLLKEQRESQVTLTAFYGEK
jgi:metal-responsive CopG/Arc/MetJ family transcriptional regulator|tara:strand:+ start:204 stop:446 length:243 start_codon:yes stop_codon:yes gene_type:complete